MNPALLYKKLYKKVSYKIFLQKKWAYQHYKFLKNGTEFGCRKILFIVGCQRSGTTIMLKTLEKDLNAKIYGEESKLSSLEGYRLNPLDMVKKEVGRDKAQLVVIKPLVESQNTPQLIKAFEASKALWMYRNYKDVASSNIKLFGIRNGINDIRPIAENQPNNWRNEKVSDDTRKIIQDHFSENMNPYDAAVLFWYARNSHFFELELDGNPDVILCKYENFIANPMSVIRDLYRSLDHHCKIEKNITDVNDNSVSKGKGIELSPVINGLAMKLLGALDSACKQTSYAPATSTPAGYFSSSSRYRPTT